MRWIAGQCNTALWQWELFIKTESVTATQRGFRHQFPRPSALPQYSANVGIKLASRRVGEGL